MTSRFWRRPVVILLCTMLALPSCSTLHTVAVPEPVHAADQRASVQAEVQRGDLVQVTLRSGETRSFEVTSVGTDSLIGKGESVAFVDIQKLQVRQSSGGKSTLLGVGVGLGMAALAFLAMLYHSAAQGD